MKRVYSAANLPDAHLVLHLLTSEGIAARVLNENLQGGLGDIPFTHTYPEVWVDDERDFARARALIKARDLAPADIGTIACPKCGEENPRNFQLCWNCGKGLTA
ncbi:MAG: putative signal transducing protein [Burkholderiales bacterium]